MRIAIYIRVSTEEQAEDGYSLAAQERACRAFAESRGWQVFGIYADEGISGRNDKRPALQRLLADMRIGRVKTIIVHKLDRLARNLHLTLEIIEELKEHNAAFVSVTEQLDLTTPIGWAMFQVQGVFAEMYSQNLSNETAKGLREKATQGGWVGPVPYGYTRSGTTLVPSDDAPVVRNMYMWYANGGESFTSIADRLNADGFRTLNWKTGLRGLFGRESTRTILRNPAYKGIVRCDGKEYPGNHEALVNAELWDRAQRVRETRTAKNGYYSVKLPRIGGMLTEIAYCSACGDRLWYHQTGRPTSRSHYYVCSGRSRRTCDATFSRAEVAEAQTLDLLRTLSLPADWRTTVLQKAESFLKPDEGKRTISPAAIQRQIEILALGHAEGDISTETFHRERERMRARLAEAHANQPTPRQLDLSKAAEVLENFDTLVDHLSPEQQRAMMRLIFSHVWMANKKVVAVRPTTLYLPLVQALAEPDVQVGCPTGFEPATS